MRRRTGAFHADTIEDYIEKVKESDNRSGGVAQHVSPFNFLAPVDRSLLTPNDYQPHLDLMQMISRCQPARPVPQTIITEGSALQEEVTGELATDSDDNQSPTIMAADKEPAFVDPESPTLQSLVVKAMVVGAKEIKRHSFIQTLVPGGESEECLAMKSPLDFVVKTDRGEARVVKYHFWIKECTRESEADRFKTIYTTYYNSVSSFIFVYSISDRESLTALRKSMEEIKRTISKEFKGLLVGLIAQDSTREVSFEEGESVATEEGLCGFLETDLVESSVNEKIVGFLTSIAETQQLRLKSKKQ